MQMTYEAWMAAVNAILLRDYELHTEFLPDWPSYDNWSDGVSPEEGAEVCLEESEMFQKGAA